MLSFQIEVHADLTLGTDFVSTGTADMMINFSFISFQLLDFIYLKKQGKKALS